MRRLLTSIALIALLLPAFGCATYSIWEAARNGNLKTVKKLIEEDPSLINAPHIDAIRHDADNRWTPLHYAVDARNRKVAQYLLEQGADPLATARSGWTPYKAARSDRRLDRMLREAIIESGRELP